MRISTSCDACFHEFSVAADLAGKRVRCPECQEPVRVSGDSASAPVRRTGRGGAGRNRASRGGQNGLLIGLAAGGGGVAVIAIVMVLLTRGGAPAAAPIADPVAVEPVAARSETAMPATSAAPAAVLAGNPALTAASVPLRDTFNPAATAAAPVPATVSAAPAPGPTPAPAVTEATPGAPLKKLDFEQLIAAVEPTVVRINVISEDGGSVGSGFVIDKDGTVVTNYHVITGARKAEVEFASGLTAKVLGYRAVNREKDIAIIKIDLPPGKLAAIGIAPALPGKGAEVLAFGAPQGLSFTSTKGIISALRNEDEMREQLGADVRGQWIQTDASISSGNSGGPLVDLYGRVVGMNTMTLATGQNLNFAVSALEIRAEVDQAPEKVIEFRPEDLKKYSKDLSRKAASEQIGTPRGRQLFSKVEEIFLINVTSRKTVALDPTGAIWGRVVIKSQNSIERSKIQLSFGEPAADAAVMFVILEMKATRRGTAGTQELIIHGQLICSDPHAKQTETPYCIVWKGEESVGTISLLSLANGTFPRAADEKLGNFFSKFRSAYQKAVREEEEADKADAGK